VARSIVLKAKNNTGLTITAGTVVYISGYRDKDQIPYISPASNDNESKMPAIGIIRDDIEHDTIGVVKIGGQIYGVDTSSASINDNVYVGKNGGITFKEPAVLDKDLITQQLGIVIKDDDSPNGQIQLYSLEIKKRIRHPDIIEVTGDQHHLKLHAKKHESGGDDVINHNLLSNLDKDGHLQYSLINGARAFTGVVSGVTPTSSTHLATKGYIDSAKRYISVYRSSDSSAALTGEYNPFGSTNGGAISEIVSNDITVNTVTGVVTIDADGIYEISVVLFMSQSGSGQLTAFKIMRNAASIWDAPVYIDTSVDPVERTAQIIYSLSATDTIEMKIDSSSTLNLQSHSGCTLNIKQIA